MENNTNTNESQIGKTLFCTFTGQAVTIIEWAEDYRTGIELIEGFKVLYPCGMTHIISVDRVGKDYLPTGCELATLFNFEAHEKIIPLSVYDADPSLEGFVFFRMAA